MMSDLLDFEDAVEQSQSWLKDAADCLSDAFCEDEDADNPLYIETVSRIRAASDALAKILEPLKSMIEGERKERDFHADLAEAQATRH